MQTKNTSSSFGKEQFNTLVQSGTNKNKLPKRVAGNGMKIVNAQTLLDFSKKKMITQSLIPKLVDVARDKGAYKRKQMYWNAYHCCNTVYSGAGNLFVDENKYCKTRICAICGGIRKAELINKYLPVLCKWKQPYFLTLTVKAVPEQHLKKLVDEVIKAFRLIIEKHRKRYNRGRGIKLMGIKSIECNFNPKEQTYNPHLHIIVPNKQIADILKKEWLMHWQELTDKKAQFYRPVRDTQNDLIEVIKYSTKVFTEFDPKKKEKKSTLVYAAAIDNIIAALEPHRVFDRFGFNLPPTKKPSGVYTKLNVYQEWHFDLKKTDWLNVETYKPLSGYKPPPELSALLDYNINTYLQ